MYSAPVTPMNGSLTLPARPNGTGTSVTWSSTSAMFSDTSCVGLSMTFSPATMEPMFPNTTSFVVGSADALGPSSRGGATSRLPEVCTRG